jgi:hypothetical protein
MEKVAAAAKARVQNQIRPTILIGYNREATT